MKCFAKDKSGVAAIEFAIVLPILIFLIIGAIEFGIHLLAGQTAQRSVASITDSIQKNPTDANLFQVAQDSGLSFTQFNVEPNFFCAKSYATLEESQESGCEKGDWDTSAPLGISKTTPYYVSLRAYAEPLTVGILTEYLPVIDYASNFQVSQGSLTPPVCTGFNKVLQFDGTNYSCEDSVAIQVSKCTGTDRALQYDGSKFICGTVTGKKSCTNFCARYDCGRNHYTRCRSDRYPTGNDVCGRGSRQQKLLWQNCS